MVTYCYSACLLCRILIYYEKQRLDLDPARRTPEMSAMHQDTSSDLRVVYEKLKIILEVEFVFCARLNSLQISHELFDLKQEVYMTIYPVSDFYSDISYLREEEEGGDRALQHNRDTWGPSCGRRHLGGAEEDGEGLCQG